MDVTAFQSGEEKLQI